MSHSVSTVADENSLRYYGWRVLLVSVLGMAFSPGPLIFGTLGVVLSSIQQEFEWGRAQLMLSLTIFTFASVFAAPIVGKLIDRLGVRRILLPSVAILGLCLLLIPASLSRLGTFYTLAFFAGFISTGAQSISYIRVLSSWFEERRGLAIGVAASGLGLGYMIMPLLVQGLITISDWRTAYYCLAALVVLLPLPLLGFVVRNHPEKEAEPTDNTAPDFAVPLAGVSAGEALKSRDFWLMTIALTIMSMFLTGLVPHVVPLLTDRGISSGTAAAAAALMGLATFCGRIVVGCLLDRFFAPLVAICFFGIAAIGLGILINADSILLVCLAIFLIGLGFGAESDLIGYLVGRYFGLKSFAQIYGYALAGFLLGAGMGPYLLGISFEYWGSYTHILIFACCMSLVACTLFKFMGPYPDYAKACEGDPVTRPRG